MFEFRRMTTYLLIFVLIFNLIGCGGSDEKVSNERGTVESDISRVEGTQDVTDIPETGFTLQKETLEKVWLFEPSTDVTWTIGEPFINPMGDEDKYSRVTFEENSSVDITYIDEGYNLVNEVIVGDVYYLSVPFNDAFSKEQNEQFQIDLGAYIDVINGQNFGSYEGQMTFNAYDASGHLWWAFTRISGDVHELTLIKEHIIDVGDVLSIDFGARTSPVYFTLKSDERSFRNLQFTFEEEFFDCMLTTQLNKRDGDYERDYRKSYYFASEFGYDYTLTDLPNESGLVRCELSWEEESTGMLRMSYNHLIDQRQDIYAEDLGAIKVSAEHVMEVKVRPSNEEVYITHPNYNSDKVVMDLTPDGDYMVFLPSGYWDVTLVPSDMSLFGYYSVLGVAVKAKEITRIEVPYSISASISQMNEAIMARGIEMNSFEEGNGKVSYNFTLLDRTTSEVAPQIDNTRIYEGGMPATIEAIERVDTPPEVYLLLDSSGSMRGEMGGVIKAAEKFIQEIPDKSVIKLVDFDSKVKELDGSSKQEALNNLKKLRVDGDTALYQSLLHAVDNLGEANRPIIVLFTDGENDLKNDYLTRDQVMMRLKNSNIPVYSIGFGKNHDDETLRAFSSSSLGRYFSAVDQHALEQVFEAINERLSNTYHVLYKRPKKPSIGDTPILTFVIDTSGSMEDIDEGFGQRILNVRELLKPFILELPGGFGVQLMGFESSPYYIQSLTNDKRKLIKGIDYLIPGGPTSIPLAIHGGIVSLKDLPSTKKLMVFLTDEALDAGDEDFLFFVEEVKKEGIRVLWVGFGNAGVEEDFKTAAELSNGEYLLTSDPDVLKEAIKKMMDEVIEMPDSGLSQVSMEVEKEDAYGNIEVFGASKLTKLTPMESGEKTSSINGIKESYLGTFSQYDLETAKAITGQTLPGDETVITSKMLVDKSQRNQAMKVSVDEIVYLSKLAGVEPPADAQFVAVKLKLDNIMEKQKVTVYPDGSHHPSAFVAGPVPIEEIEMVPDYMIPDFKNHFFLDVNGKGGTNASIATYLAAGSLPVPGDSSIKILENEPKEGILVFLVPDEAVTHMSLHFYDVSYGHVHLPIIGRMAVQDNEVETLPKTAGKQLSDTFSLGISSVKDVPVIDASGEVEEDVLMREIVGIFTSNVQALLSLNPKERIFLEIGDGQGAYTLPVHPRTSQIPLGHYTQKLVAPGSQNISKWLFELPKGFENKTANLVVELEGGDVVLPLVDKGNSDEGQPLFQGEVDIDGDDTMDFEVRIMQALITKEYVGNISDGTALLEIVIKDYKDGFSTSGIEDLFEITDFSGEKKALASAYNDDLLLAYNESSAVIDGRVMRGIIVYDTSSLGIEEWYVRSPFLEDLELKLETQSIPSYFTAMKHYYQRDDDYDSRLLKAVNHVIEQYRSDHADRIEMLADGLVQLEENDKAAVAVPSVGLYGRNIMNEVKTVDDIKQVLKGLEYVPSDRFLDPYEYLYAPEATVTQGFGVSNDYAKIAVDLLSRLGYTPKKKVVMLTEKGKSALDEFAGRKCEIQHLPAVEYVDGGMTHLLVMPFVEELKDLSGLVYYSQDQWIKDTGETLTLTVSIMAESQLMERNDSVRDMNDALAGDVDAGPNVEWIEVLYRELPLDVLSKAPIDLGFSDDGSRYTCSLNVDGHLIKGSDTLLKRVYTPKAIELKIISNHKEIVKVIPIEEMRMLNQYLITLGINLPDIDTPALTALEEAAEIRRAMVEAVDDYSALKWYGSEIIYSFIATHSKEEQSLARRFDLKIGRTNSERIIVLTMKAPTEQLPFEASIDLMQSINDVHSGSDEAIRSFNIMSGLFATVMESYALGEDGVGAIDIIGLTPQGTDIILMKPYLEDQELDELLDAGVPERTVEYLTGRYKYVLMPNQPATINGTRRWAWIEIDPETYQTIGVIDSLENGAMVSRAITGTVKDIGQYFVGGFVGVSSSIWSVSAFSLMEDDYDTILKDAKAFVMGMKNSFGVKEGSFSVAIGGKPQVGAKYGPLKASFNGKMNIGTTVVGFTEGFVAGINKYFEEAE